MEKEGKKEERRGKRGDINKKQRRKKGTRGRNSDNFKRFVVGGEHNMVLHVSVDPCSFIFSVNIFFFFF